MHCCILTGVFFLCCLQVWHCLVALGVSCLDFSSRVRKGPAVLIEEESEYDS